VSDLALPATPAGYTGTPAAAIQAVETATGEMVFAYKLGATGKLPDTVSS
jgi:hypothetical protein